VNIVLDNCVHYRAKSLFPGNTVLHARDLGWKELSYGELIAQTAAGGFDVLVTTDKKIRHEHNLDRLQIPVLVLNARFMRLADLTTLAPHLESALAATRDFRFVSVTPDGALECLGDRRSP